MTSTLDDAARHGGQELAGLNLVKYSSVISATVFWLEILAKMDDEIEYIWPSRTSIVKAVYLFNRYLPIVDTTLAMTSTLNNSISKKLCTTEFQLMSFVYLLGSFCTELILMTRTLSLYNFSAAIKMAMAILAFILIVPPTIFDSYYILRLSYPSSATIRITGCVPDENGNFRMAWLLFAAILLSETVIVILTFWRMWQMSDKRFHAEQSVSDAARLYASSSSIVNTLYYDGSFYYIIMLVLSVVNLCVTLLGSPAVLSCLQMPVRVVHSTLGTRVLLNLRTVAARSTELPQLDFATVNSLTFDRFAFGDDLGYTVDESAGAEEERGISYGDCGGIDIIEAASPHPVSSREMNV